MVKVTLMVKEKLMVIGKYMVMAKLTVPIKETALLSVEINNNVFHKQLLRKIEFLIPLLSPFLILVGVSIPSFIFL